ncbi:MAG TPA: hypothetical protein VLE49_15645 [Anaerolineales bacterium]|nr:hypothetical protein [Anaerolineales bacterium]
MSEPKEFFSSNHKRLLSIAVWAKYLAWVVLVVYLLNAALQMFQYHNFSNYVELQPNIWEFLRANPFEAFQLGVNVATTALRGVIFYLVLKGISLGLNMIVETDINYREQEGDAE